RMHKLDCVGYATTRSHGALEADRSDIATSHDIAGSLISAPAAVGTPRLRPFSAYGARLRRVGFLDLDTRRELIAQQVDQFAVAGRRNGLSLLPTHLLAGIVEGFADVGCRVWERVGNLARRLVTQVADLVLGLGQVAVLGALESLVPPRTLGFLGLLG